jgi:hypothetical protein
MTQRSQIQKRWAGQRCAVRHDRPKPTAARNKGRTKQILVSTEITGLVSQSKKLMTVWDAKKPGE